MLHRFSIRTLARALCLAGLLATTLLAPAAEITPLLTGPSEPIQAGRALPVWLNWLNTTPQPVVQSVPASIACRLANTATRFESRLELRTAADAGDVTIPAGGFIRREYLLNAPGTLAGAVWLDLPGAPANRIMVEIAPAGILTGKSTERGTNGPATADKIESNAKDPFDAQGLFKRHIFGHEPFYFIVGPESPNAKIQLSFKYRMISADDSPKSWAHDQPWLEGFHFAYTQTSLWDWQKNSAPFFDTSYKPEMLYSTERVAQRHLPDWLHLDLAGGIQHESNGKDGTNSRSINLAYLRPTLTFDLSDEWFLSLSPKAFVYLPDVDDNPDIAKYRGYGELRATIGKHQGAQLSSIFRLGSTGQYGSVELDFTYPLWEPWNHGPKVYFMAQYFTGYGESILLYNRSSSAFRAGFSLYR